MAELHVIGEISHAVSFPQRNLFCKWTIQYGNNWRVISGQSEGQTQVDSGEYEDISRWFYPLDIHLASRGIQGWPKLLLQVFHLDWLGRSHLFAYGYINIPASPGSHSIDCYTWRPVGTSKDRFVQFFLGGGPQLKFPDLVFSGHDRYKLNTESMGVVTVKLNLIFKNFKKFGVEY